jgi:hypothetical protein
VKAPHFFLLEACSFGGRERGFGDVVDPTTAAALGAELDPMMALPVDADAIGAHPLGGVGYRHFGTRGVAVPSVVPATLCTVALYALRHLQAVHWRACLVPEAWVAGGGELSVGRLSLTGSSNTPGLLQPTVRDGAGRYSFSGPRAVIGGTARFSAVQDALVGLSLYGSGTNARISWFAVSQASV